MINIKSASVKLLMCSLGLLVMSGFTYASRLNCLANERPRLIKPIENWEIIASNTATISTKKYFHGKQLIFSILAKERNKKNKITINTNTGVIHITAEGKDEFDVKVAARNPCGEAAAIFNVKVDEEE